MDDEKMIDALNKINELNKMNKMNKMNKINTTNTVYDITKFKRSILDYKFNDPDPHSFIHIGVKKNNKSKKNIMLNGKNIIIDETMIINPFFMCIEGDMFL